MTYAQFARQLRPLVEPLGAVRAAELCGVSERAIRMWLRAEARPALCTMRGALDILRENQPAEIGVR